MLPRYKEFATPLRNMGTYIPADPDVATLSIYLRNSLSNTAVPQ